MKAWRHSPACSWLLAPGRRAVTAALRILGREHEADDATGHGVLAIARTTPALLGLFSLVVLWMDDLVKSRRIRPQATSWYRKTRPASADAIAAVRREIRHHRALAISRADRDVVKIRAHIWSRVEAALAHARWNRYSRDENLDEFLSVFGQTGLQPPTLSPRPPSLGGPPP